MRALRHALLLVPLVTIGLAAESWSELPPLSRAVAGHAAAMTPRGLWVAGGSTWDGSRKLIASEVQFRAHGEKAWRTLASFPDGYAHGASAADDEALWLVGGLGTSGLLKAIQRVDLVTGRVETVAELPEPLLYSGAALKAGSLYVVGGTKTDGDFAQASSAWWRFDVQTRTLHRQPTPGPAWINPVVLGLGGDLHVLPGGAWSAERKRLEAPTSAWIFRTGSGTWEQRRFPLEVPRGLMAVPLDEGQAWVAGGIVQRDGTAAFSDAAWIYEAAAGAWLPTARLPVPLLAGAMTRDQRRLLLLGGEDGPRRRSARVWQLSLPRSTASASPP